MRWRPEPAIAGSETGGTHEDADGLINMPLTVKEIQAVAFFKEIAPASYRVSLRSKGDVDVESRREPCSAAAATAMPPGAARPTRDRENWPTIGAFPHRLRLGRALFRLRHRSSWTAS